MLRASSTFGRALIGASVLMACTAGPREESGRAPGTAAGSSTRAAGAAASGVDALYVLDAIGTEALPAVAFKSASGDRRIEVLAESLWLRPDGSFAARVALRDTERGRAGLRGTTLAGRYTLRGAVLSGEGQLSSGDVVLSRPPDLTSTLTVRSGGLLRGYGLPVLRGGVPRAIIRTYRRLPRPAG